MQFVQSFRFDILPTYDCCYIDFFDQSFFPSFPISASQPTASPLRRRNAISLVCVLARWHPPLCSGLGCCFCWNFITWSRWNNCVHLYSWIHWRPSMFRTHRFVLVFSKVLSLRMGKLGSCFLMIWKGGTVKGIVHVSQRSKLLHECQAKCTRCHQQNHIRIVSSQKNNSVADQVCRTLRSPAKRCFSCTAWQPKFLPTVTCQYLQETTTYNRYNPNLNRPNSTELTVNWGRTACGFHQNAAWSSGQCWCLACPHVSYCSESDPSSSLEVAKNMEKPSASIMPYLENHTIR